jgi:hypothetical protein
MNIRINTKNKNHKKVANWGLDFQGAERWVRGLPAPGTLVKMFENEMKDYFRLCALARSKSADELYVKIAKQSLFRVRTILEESVGKAINNSEFSNEEKLSSLLKCFFFSFSKKQGISLRLPLSTCHPTKLCANGCYAHDVLDATPAALVKGVINGWIANYYEMGNNRDRSIIEANLKKHILRAVNYAKKELSNLPSGFSRRAYIRFSHVGEIVVYPDFSNFLAKIIRSSSGNEVDCVVYSRHSKVSKLDPKLWVINFTLDPESLDRKHWAPDSARIVFSAFGGIVSREAEINFLEHHRNEHLSKTSGTGNICPATLPNTKNRTCDACQCSECFKRPE